MATTSRLDRITIGSLRSACADCTEDQWQQFAAPLSQSYRLCLNKIRNLVENGDLADDSPVVFEHEVADKNVSTYCSRYLKALAAVGLKKIESRFSRENDKVRFFFVASSTVDGTAPTPSVPLESSRTYVGPAVFLQVAIASNKAREDLNSIRDHLVNGSEWEEPSPVHRHHVLAGNVLWMAILFDGEAHSVAGAAQRVVTRLLTWRGGRKTKRVVCIHAERCRVTVGDGGISGLPNAALFRDPVSEFSPSSKPAHGGHFARGLRIVVTPRTYGLLRHRFVCEPYGEQRSVGVVHQLWGRRRARRLSKAGGERVREFLDETPSEQPLVVVARPKATDETSKSDVAEACTAIEACAETVTEFVEDALDETVWRWQFSPRERGDLMNPIAASMRDLLDVNRADDAGRLRTTLESRLSNIYTRNGLPARLGRWLFEGMGEADEERFGEIVADVENVLKHSSSIDMGRKGPVTLVVESPEHADVLSLDIIGWLSGVSDVRLVLVGADAERMRKLAPGARLQDVDVDRGVVVTPDRDERLEENLLLDIAACLGPNFLREWLFSVWVRLSHVAVEEAEQRFESELADLLSRGVFLYAGCLCDAEGSFGDREMSFASRTLRDEIMVTVEDNFEQSVIRAFASGIEEIVRRNGVSGVRRKLRVLEILDRIENVEVLDTEFRCNAGMLARLTGDRVPQDSRCRTEKLRRYEFGLKMLSGVEVVDRECAELFVDLQKDCLVRIRTREEFEKFRPGAETNGRERVEKLPRDQAGRVFEWARSLWQMTHRFGNATEAFDQFETIVSPFRESLGKDDELEWYHVATVSRFATGDVNACLRHAEEGRRICMDREQVISSHPGVARRGTSHDPASCCKVFRALSLLMLGRRGDADDALDEALGYVTKLKEEQGDVVSLRITTSYVGLFHVMVGEYEEGVVALDGAEPCGHERWDLFFGLVHCCARIGRELTCESPDPSSVQDDLVEIRSRREQWGCDEYSSMWHVFEAVGRRMLGDYGGEREMLQQADRVELARGETFFRSAREQLFGV